MLTHASVLLGRVLTTIDPRPGMTIVDCTIGLAGHANAMLSRISPGGRLIGTDLDSNHVEISRAVLTSTGGDFSLFNTNFAGLPGVLTEAGVGRVHGLLADLGVASPQIDDPQRGFSYRKPGPLDMRMDASRGRPASHLLATLGERELADALRELGDEEDADAIAALIVQRRAVRPIETTQDLAEIVCTARHFTLKRAAGAKLHPAARTFQALRILTNRELANLDRLLTVLPSILKPGGVAAIISFHSGEDRRVKHAFRDGFREGIYQAISDDPLTATEAEEKQNPRARSAKLRWARRGRD